MDLIQGNKLGAFPRQLCDDGIRTMQHTSIERTVASFPVHIILIATIVIVSLVGLTSDAVKRALILNPYRVRHNGQVYRLFTAGWLHSDFAHLAFNMLTLYFFADDVLKILGPVRFLALYLTAVVLGYVPTTLRQMHKKDYNSLGASGAVAAVLFSAILLIPKLKMQFMFIPFPIPGIVFGLGYLAYIAWQSYNATDNVNHDAHFAGAIYGSMLTFVLEPARVERTIRSFF
jgi:membrane associated rhomboid family serine protease